MTLAWWRCAEARRTLTASASAIAAGRTALSSALMRCMVVSQSGMLAISSMSPDPADTVSLRPA
jgi:hypothetical protein